MYILRIILRQKGAKRGQSILFFPNGHSAKLIEPCRDQICEMKSGDCERPTHDEGKHQCHPRDFGSPYIHRSVTGYGQMDYLTIVMKKLLALKVQR